MELLSEVFLNTRGIQRRAPELSPFQQEIASQVETWSDDTPQVAVLGAFSAGKSTLLNRLLGDEILPAARTPTTAVVTKVRYSERPVGVLKYRRVARVSLLSQNARTPDLASVAGLRSWLSRPADFAITGIREVGGDGSAVEVDNRALLRELEALEPSNTAVTDARSGLMPALTRALSSVGRPPERDFARTFEVHFRPKADRSVSLEDSVGLREFGRCLTEPQSALSIQRAVCGLPDARLKQLNFLDTAGLCSPVGFHKQVTAELLSRRPDKVLVLLDSRRLDSPTNREALQVLGRFVSVPDDYRQVTFVLTFWDLALRNHMWEDSEPELDYHDVAVRAQAAKRLASRRRRDLKRLLSESVGVECDREPQVFPVGLGAKAPPDLARGIGEIWRHLQHDCGGWVGIEMWAERWRGARAFGDRLSEVLTDTIEDVEESRHEALSSTDLDSDAKRAANRVARLLALVELADDSLNDVLSAQQERMLTEVGTLDSKSQLVEYLDSGHWESANAALNALQSESQRQLEELRAQYRGARGLRAISLDRRLLGLGPEVRERAKGEVTGIGYGLKSVWDFLFGGVRELSADNREAAREVLRLQVLDMMELLRDSIETWMRSARLVAMRANEDYQEQLHGIAARRDNTQRYVDALERKLAFLHKSRPHVERLQNKLDRFARELDQARSRIAASRQPDFQVVLQTVNQQHTFTKGREQDVLILHQVGAEPWKWLEMTAGGKTTRYYPNAERRGVSFSRRKPKGDPVRRPRDRRGVMLHLSRLEGRFIGRPQQRGGRR